MKKYTANLSLQALVPENQLLEPHIKYSIEFDILCPINGCDTIKANGFDTKFSPPVQFYKCKVHNRTFYAHTSWVMKKLTEIIIQRIIIKSFSSSVSGMEIAERYNLNVSTLSRLLNKSEEYVDLVIGKINQQKEKLKNLSLPAMLEDVIWIDETFFKIGKQSWALILAVDYNGRVLGWKFGRTREANDIIDVLTQVGQYMPDWKVVIGDGARAYATAVRSFHTRAYLIQQYHTHPWEWAKITAFLPEGQNEIIENVIELDYQALLHETPQTGFAISKPYKVNIAKKKRGRKKGQKNGTGKKKIKKIKEKDKKKRGPKTARGSGRAFQFGHTLEFLKIDWLEPTPKGVDTPTEEDISEMLWLTSMVFGNKSIVSNRVESVNSEFKLIIPNRGMQNEKQVSNRINRFIQLKNVSPINSNDENLFPVSPRLGFNNLMNFCEPMIENIVLQKEVVMI